MDEHKRLHKIIEGDKTLFKRGDKIEWVYNHWLNSKSYTRIVKKGVFLRYIRNRRNVSQFNGMCLVQFDGNKNPSRIHNIEIKLQ